MNGKFVYASRFRRRLIGVLIGCYQSIKVLNIDCLVLRCYSDWLYGYHLS